jgi:hypothetical protein
MSGCHLDRWKGALPTIGLLTVIVLLSGVFLFLSGPAPESALGATSPPQVTSVSPADGTENRPLDQVFTVTFDQDMNPATIVPGSLFIYKWGGSFLPATVSYDAATRTATLTPLAKLDPGSTYWVELSVTVKSAAGVGVLGAPLRWHFYTIPPVPAHIAGQTPADGATGCPLNQVVTVTFDTPMDASTFTSTSFYFAKAGGLPLPATLAYDPATLTATLTPAALLEEASTYYVTLTSAVRGATATFVVGTPVVWSFSTILVQPPAILSYTPLDGAQEQPLDVMVTVTFDRLMDRNTVCPETFFIQKVGAATVDSSPLPAVLTCDGLFTSLTPAIELDPDTTYRVTMTSGLKSAKGASFIGAPKSWTFKTKKVPLPFSDVQVTHPYFTAIFQLAKRHVISGFGDDTFRPAILVSRQQFAKMIIRALGHPVTEDSVCPFPDVLTSTPGHFVDPEDPLYPDHYVAAAFAHGIIEGKNATTFAPYENITRFQAVTMVVRALDDIDRGLLKNPPSTYQSTWNPALSPDHGQNARLAEFNGLLAQLPLATLDPLAPMTRGGIAQLEWNLIKFLQ